MAKLITLSPVVCLLIALFYAGGCSKESAGPKPVQGNAFDSASPEIKSEWDKVLAADKANDYATAILTARSLQGNQSLTPEQQQAAGSEMAAVQGKMSEALKNNDPAAQAALKKIRENWR